MSARPPGVPAPTRKPHIGPDRSEVTRIPGRLKTTPTLTRVALERQRVRAFTRHEQEAIEEQTEEVRERLRERQREHQDRLRAAGWRELPNGKWKRPKDDNPGKGKGRR